MAKPKKKGPKKSAAKKRWVPILAPKMFNSMTIGDTHIYDPREGIGKELSVNLMTLTRNPKSQGTNVSFVVTGQHEGKLLTGFTGLRIMPSVVRRMVRRGKDKIDDSFICLTSDGKKIRLKPIIITRTKAKGSVLTAMRKELRKHIVKEAGKSSYDKLSEDIVAGRFQRGIYEVLSQLAPVVKCEIRWLKLLTKEHKPAVEAPVEDKAEEEVPKEEAKAEEKPPEAPKEEAKEEPKAEVPKEEVTVKKEEKKEDAEASN